MTAPAPDPAPVTRMADRQEPKRVCAHCGGPIPRGSREGARYCKVSCKQAAYRARKKEAA